MKSNRIDRADVPQPTLVLRTLEALGPLHAYGLGRRVEQISKRDVQLNQSALYSTVSGLEQEVWISSKWGASTVKRLFGFDSSSWAEVRG
jgi:DNA-binding PadR family transcriptional regulator